MSDNVEKPELTENEVKSRSVIKEFVQEYRNKPADESNVKWLNRQFSKYPELWPDAAAREKDAAEIVESVEKYQAAKAELDEHLANGGSREKYIVSKIEASAAAAGAVNVGEYASKIDSAISQANEEMAARVFTKDGNINMNPQLKGNIMEADQVATFNIDAAANGSNAHAVAPEAYNSNSVDITVKTEDGSLQRYQAKCSKTPEQAEQAFHNGEYRGQRKLVAKGQTDEVPNSTDHLAADGVKSEARTNEEYERMQEKVQKDGEIPSYDWNNANKVAIAKSIGKKATWAAAMAVGYQAVRILGRRTWNWITGKENPTVEEDLKEFVQSSLESAGGAGIVVAVTGGATVAVKSGWLGKALQGTPAGIIANAVCVGIENAKILYKLGKGEIDGKEALNQAGNATCSLLGGFWGAGKGMAIGTALGGVLGPVGAAVGCFVGAAVGGIAGSTVGQMLYSGAKKVVQTVGSAIKSVRSAVWNGVKSAGRAVASFFGF